MRTTSMILLPCLLAAGAFFLWTRRFNRQRDDPPHDPAVSKDDDEPYVCPPFVKPLRFRAKFSAYGGVIVHGWPAKGGIYVLGCSGLDLDFLGLDRFHDTMRPSESGPEPDARANEENHCNKMRQLGATWYPSEAEWALDGIGYSYPTDPFLSVGWPAGGGVWVLKLTRGEANDRGTGVISNARSMEERCRLIERLGGVFYANPKDCPHLDLP